MNNFTWNDIYNDFIMRHPKLKKQIVKWEPNIQASIAITLKGGATLIYNYETKKTSLPLPT